MGKFEIRNSGFYLNDEPFKVLAGAIHYFRVPREYWRDRLLKLKACGFNTVETYVAWNRTCRGRTRLTIPACWI